MKTKICIFANITIVCSMKILNGFENIVLDQCSVISIGTYDGIHAGHKKVITKLVQDAKEHQCLSVVITFSPHPRLVLYPEQKDLKLIDTEEEKFDKFRKMGIDVLIVIPFSKEFAATSYIHFVEEFLVKKLSIRKFVLGKDHRFGKHREGNLEAMQNLAETYNFTIDYVSTYEFEGIEVSSTKIRKAIVIGDIEKANKMIGDYFSLEAHVIEGRKIGQHIGFPTANLEIENPYKLIPPEGVYAVIVLYDDKKYKGMLNIGKNPTVSNDANLKTEVHILDFSQNIYGDSIRVLFVKRIRNEMKFDNLDMLKQQLSKDKSEIINTLLLH